MCNICCCLADARTVKRSEVNEGDGHMKKRTARTTGSGDAAPGNETSRTAADWKRLQSDVRGLKLLTHLQLQLIRNLEHVAETALQAAPKDQES